MNQIDLFQFGVFRLHSGRQSVFKIDCDSLSDNALDALALVMVPRIQSFSDVYGVPTGGLRFARAFEKFRGTGDLPVLLVDDVFTTGASMAEIRDSVLKHRAVVGAVIIARGPTPHWVTPFITLNEKWWDV